MKFELIVLSMLILTINCDETSCKAGNAYNDVTTCTNVTVDGKVCCYIEEKVDDDHRTKYCDVLADKSEATAKAYGSPIATKNTTLEKVKVNCGGTDGEIEVYSEEGLKFEEAVETCEDKTDPSNADDCSKLIDSTLRKRGYCCLGEYKLKNAPTNTNDKQEAKTCMPFSSAQYANLTEVIEEIKESVEEGNEYLKLSIDCGSGLKKASMDSSGKIAEETNPASGANLLKTGIIISIFALLI